MEKRGKELPNRLGSIGSQMNRSDLRNSLNVVGSHEFKVLHFSCVVRDTSILIIRKKRGKEPPNRLGSKVSQMNPSNLRNSSSLVGSHGFQVLRFPYNVRNTSIYRAFTAQI